MQSTPVFPRGIYMVFCLCLSLAKEGGTVPMTWLEDSITDLEAVEFCKDILQVCKEKTYNQTPSLISKTCGAAECCTFTSVKTKGLESLESLSVLDDKTRQLRNLCFTKWAFSELLVGDDITTSAMFLKFARLSLLKRESSNQKMAEKIKLEKEIMQLAALGFDRQSSPLEGTQARRVRFTPGFRERPNHRVRQRQHQITAGKGIKKVRLGERETISFGRNVGLESIDLAGEHTRTVRSVVNISCNTFAHTVLYRAPGCVPKSMLLFTCRGRCLSRSEPRWDSGNSQIVSVESCSCCSASRLRYRLTTFICPGRPANVVRRVAWPFECRCRPCSIVPELIPHGSS